MLWVVFASFGSLGPFSSKSLAFCWVTWMEFRGQGNVFNCFFSSRVEAKRGAFVLELRGNSNQKKVKKNGTLEVSASKDSSAGYSKRIQAVHGACNGSCLPRGLATETNKNRLLTCPKDLEIQG